MFWSNAWCALRRNKGQPMTIQMRMTKHVLVLGCPTFTYSRCGCRSPIQKPVNAGKRDYQKRFCKLSEVPHFVSPILRYPVIYSPKRLIASNSLIYIISLNSFHWLNIIQEDICLCYWSTVTHMNSLIQDVKNLTSSRLTVQLLFCTFSKWLKRLNADLWVYRIDEILVVYHYIMVVHATPIKSC